MTMPLENHYTFSTSPNAVTRDLNGELVILDIKQGTYFALNEVGKRVWELIREQRAFEQICQQIQDEFEAPGEQILADVHQFVNHLLQHHLVQISSH
jgi:hypothetical protein